MPSLSSIDLVGVRKSYLTDSGTLEVLGGVDMHVESGQFVSILGPSGSGKTTVLRLLAGLARPDSGEVRLKLVDGRPASMRDIVVSMAFQDSRLLPWINVAGNVACGLHGRSSRTRSGVWHQVAKALDCVGLSGFERYYPRQLSGGMAQRVGLARAIVGDPDLLLLDEPLGSLDIRTRLELQDLLAGLLSAPSDAPQMSDSESLSADKRQNRQWPFDDGTGLRPFGARPITVMVTHDIDEAVYLSDLVYLLSSRPGVVVGQVVVGAPRPRSRVAPTLVAAKAEILSMIRMGSESS